MRNLHYSSVISLAAIVCLSSLGCHGGFQKLATCGCAEEPCDLATCGCAEEPCDLATCGCAEEPYDLATCGCAEEPCDLATCGCAEEPCDLATCGCAEEPFDTVGCGNCIGCGRQSCSWWKKLIGCFQLCGCDGCGGELYWSEWHNDPPGCEPCDSCGNWIGSPGVYRAPYRTLPDLATEPRIPPQHVQATEFAVPEGDGEQALRTQESEYEQLPKEALELSLEQKTFFR